MPGKDFVIVDNATEPGGSWQHMWPGLRLFSPSTFSSLPGWMMPTWNDAKHGYPPRSHVVDYLTRYEERYELGVRRPWLATAVNRETGQGELTVTSNARSISARFVVSATGTWTAPFWPTYPGMPTFEGRQLHAADYHGPAEFVGQHVVVVGGGNSAAQILAEVSQAAVTTWVSSRPPRFLPDDVDGRDLFMAATARVKALNEGREHSGVGGLGDIVMVPTVVDARDRGALKAEPMFTRLDHSGIVWSDGAREHADAVIWCTGFRPSLRHLRSLQLRKSRGYTPVGGPAGTRVLDEDRLYLVGYGDWTGPASATLIGVGRTARDTVADILHRLD